MSQSATSAPGDVSINPQIQHRIRKYAEDHPKETEYCLNDEVEASEFLLAIAAVTTLAVRNERPGSHRSAMRSVANSMRKAVIDSEPYEYLSTMDDLEIFGMTITIPEHRR